MNKTLVYKEALKIYKLSLSKVVSSRYTKNTKLSDYSHLPKEMYNVDYLDTLYSKINNSSTYKNLREDGKFNVYLTFKESLILLLKTNIDNVHYEEHDDIDLDNYKLGINIYYINLIK